jgi:hypothetical protein
MQAVMITSDENVDQFLDKCLNIHYSPATW